MVTIDGRSLPFVYLAFEDGCTALAPLYLDALSGANELGSKHESKNGMSINMAA